MSLQTWFSRAVEPSSSSECGPIAGAPKSFGLVVTRDEWRQAAEDFRHHGARLISLWATRDGDGRNVVRAAFIADPGLLLLSLSLSAAHERYPGLETWFPSA